MTFPVLQSRSGGDREDYFLMIRSADRDMALFPNSNAYRINMPMTTRNITRVALRSVEFTETQYAVTTTNNIIVISRGGTVTAVALKEGTYLGASLASELSTKLSEAAPGLGAVSVTYDADNGKLTFSSSIANDILLVAASQLAGGPNFFDNLGWDVVGLGQRATDLPLPDTGAGDTPVLAPEQINITPDAYLTMEVLWPQIITGHMRSTTAQLNPFAKIIFSTDNERRFDGFIQTRPSDFVSAPAKFLRIGVLDHMSFRFTRPNGDLYDFHHHEHSFTLQITTEA